MRTVRGFLLGVAIFQALSTAVGTTQLLTVPEWYAPMLEHTAFAGQFALAAGLLAFVGAFQLAAVLIHLRPRWRRRLALGHAVAGTVMIGWIAGECLIMDSFIWPHALWGGLGVVQLLLVLVLLGVLRPDAGAPATTERVA